ncbi:MAG: DNA polymerase III subunit gamma/tau [Patescibacteria group bacterium]
MALAIYRKYRPKKFEDCVGQDEIVKVLQNAARKDKLAHAYLFCGPRGSGKTTMARLVAKIANCETRKNDSKFKEKGEPCNKCASCSEIDSGRALDVVEIDAASNRGIDEIRSLKEGITFSPTSRDYKVFIIDEVHMLTGPAFNALLKTLEEPPEHAILILATTEYDKIPATIASRSQKFYFRKLSLKEIIQKLSRIIKTEKLNVAADATELIAATAEGSLRDAESLLDQLASMEKEITLESVEKIIGQVGFVKTAKLADYILNNQLKEALEHLSKISDGGYNIVDLNKELIHYLRRVLALRVDSSLENLYKNELTGNELEQIKKHSEILDPKKHINLLKSLIRAYSEMRYSPFAIVPLEIAIIECLQQS